MSTIRQRISELLTLVETETDENTLLKDGRNGLNELRSGWRANRSEYSVEDIESLRLATSQLDAIEQFIEEEEEFEYISDRDDADEVIARLYPLVEATSVLAIAGRIQKEIRELVERKQKMPTKASRQRSAKTAQAIRSLSASAPECRNPTHENPVKMTLREGPPNVFFWGCPTFPGCWRKLRLSREEQTQFQD